MRVQAGQEKCAERPPRSRASLVPGMHRAIKKQECTRRNTLLACRPNIRAARDRPIAQPSSRTPWRRALEHAGRALASALLHPGPRSGRWSPLAAQADPEGAPSRVHGHRGSWLQEPRQHAEGYTLTQARVGVQGLFLDASC